MAVSRDCEHHAGDVVRPVDRASLTAVLVGVEVDRLEVFELISAGTFTVLLMALSTCACTAACMHELLGVIDLLGAAALAFAMFQVGIVGRRAATFDGFDGWPSVDDDRPDLGGRTARVAQRSFL